MYFDKTRELPEIYDLMGWRVLIAVQEMRMDATLSSKLVDVQMHFDQKGSETVQRYREWAETVVPALAKERKRQDEDLRKQLDTVGKMGPLTIQPVAADAFMGIRYAESLMKGGKPLPLRRR